MSLILNVISGEETELNPFVEEKEVYVVTLRYYNTERKSGQSREMKVGSSYTQKYHHVIGISL